MKREKFYMRYAIKRQRTQRILNANARRDQALIELSSDGIVTANNLLDEPTVRAVVLNDHDITQQKQSEANFGQWMDVVSVRDHDSKLTDWVATAQDISERKQAEEALNRRNEELSLLLEAGRELSGALELNQIYPILYRFIKQWVPCTMMVVSLYNPQDEMIRCAYMRDDGGVVDISNLPPILINRDGKGTQSIVIVTGKSMLIPDFDTQRKTANATYYVNEEGKIFDDEEMVNHPGLPRSSLIVPLVIDGQVAGALQVQSNILAAHTEEHLRFVEALVFRVAAAMSNAQLFQRLQDELQERRVAEEEIRTLNAELEQRVTERTADLRRAARAKDEFLASMSHELRTPLNAILTLSESLEGGIYAPLNERQKKPLHTIVESGYHLLNLINDILDLSKIEAGKLTIQIAPVEVAGVCQASLRLVKQQAHNKGMQLPLQIDPGVRYINADGRYLKQMLVNLLSNAVKFTPEGGQMGLLVEGDAQSGVVRFTVWDTGIGISPEQALRLFQPFVQIDSGLARQHGGTGLGLSLVSRMAKLHGGTVSLESAVGEGSRFTISLPWSLQDNTPQPPARVLNRLNAPVSGDKSDSSLPGTPPAHTILIVDDHLENQAALAEYLSAQSYRILLASNGVDAIRSAGENQPHLILMDIQMPGMDGLEAIGRLRADPNTRRIPIFALTALAMPGDRERCLEAGANEYIAKPVRLKHLVQQIQTCLSMPPSGSALYEPGNTRNE